MKYAICSLGIVVVMALVASSQDSGKATTKPDVAAPAAPPGLPGQPKGPSFHLNRPFHFQVQGKDEMVKLDVGWYLAKPEGDAGIRLKAAEGDVECVLVAGPLTHEEKIDEPAAAIYECSEDVAKVVFLRPGGKGLCAPGSYSGARVRGAEEEFLRYIFADAQQPATWGAIPAGAKILRIHPDEVGWANTKWFYMWPVGAGNGWIAQCDPGYKSVHGYHTVRLPPGVRVLQLRLVADDRSSTLDSSCAMRGYRYGVQNYVPQGTVTQHVVVVTSGVLDWAWRSDWLSLPALGENEFLELYVVIANGSSFRHIDVVYMPAPA